MAAATQASTRKTNPLVKVLSLGAMVKPTKATGRMESIMARAKRFSPMERFSTVNGKTAYPMVLLYASIQMEVNMKGNG